MLLLVATLGSCAAPDSAAPDSAAPLEVVNSASDCPEIVDAFVCEQGPTGEVGYLWQDRPGYGSSDGAVWGSASAVSLYVSPAAGFSPGTVALDVGASEISVLRIVVSDCDLPSCPWPVAEGSLHISGELSECPADTAAEPCLAGTLTFEFTGLIFESGGTAEPMSLQAGFGPDQPPY